MAMQLRCACPKYGVRNLPCSLSWFAPFVIQQASPIAGWALCGHETPAGQGPESTQSESPAQQAADRPASPHKQTSNCTDGTSAAIRAAASTCPSSTADHVESYDTVIQLSRDERIVLGQKCKRLIDAGREDWLLQQGFQARFL